MNPDTGHLVDLNDERLKLDHRGDYEPVPVRLEEAARRKLNCRSEAMVSKHSGGQLSRWAAERRREKRRKRNKIAKQSRKANRT